MGCSNSKSSARLIQESQQSKSKAIDSLLQNDKIPAESTDRISKSIVQSSVIYLADIDTKDFIPAVALEVQDTPIPQHQPKPRRRANSFTVGDDSASDDEVSTPQLRNLNDLSHHSTPIPQAQTEFEQLLEFWEHPSSKLEPSPPSNSNTSINVNVSSNVCHRTSGSSDGSTDAVFPNLHISVAEALNYVPSPKPDEQLSTATTNSDVDQNRSPNLVGSDTLTSIIPKQDEEDGESEVDITSPLNIFSLQKSRVCCADFNIDETEMESSSTQEGLNQTASFWSVGSSKSNMSLSQYPDGSIQKHLQTTSSRSNVIFALNAESPRNTMNSNALVNSGYRTQPPLPTYHNKRHNGMQLSQTDSNVIHSHQNELPSNHIEVLSEKISLQQQSKNASNEEGKDKDTKGTERIMVYTQSQHSLDELLGFGNSDDE